MPHSTPDAPGTRPLTIAVIIGSTREGRVGGSIGRWVADHLAPRTDLNVDLVDLADCAVPHILPDFAAEVVPPQVAALGARLAAADGFVIVTPEYNHGVPAGLKNAVDWFYAEWNAKPVAFVSYGGMGRGFRAVEHLRQTFVELHAMTTRDGLGIDLDELDDHGRPSPDCEGAVKQMADQLSWWATALRSARTERPYAA